MEGRINGHPSRSESQVSKKGSVSNTFSDLLCFLHVKRQELASAHQKCSGIQFRGSEFWLKWIQSKLTLYQQFSLSKTLLEFPSLGFILIYPSIAHHSCINRDSNFEYFNSNEVSKTELKNLKANWKHKTSS